MPYIGLVTTDDESLHGADPEIFIIGDALRRIGITSSPVIWHQTHDWQAFDLLVIRAPWDYQERYEEFSRWLNSVEKYTRVLNAPDLIRWNSDKMYLSQLAELGINTGQTHYCSTLSECTRTIKRYVTAHRSYVIKPNVSASSQHTGLFTDSTRKAEDLCQEILQAGKTVLVQQAIAEVQEGGEHDLIFLNGEFSHAIAKGAILRPGGGYLDDTNTDKTEPVSPTPAEIQLGHATLDAVAHLAHMNGWHDDAALPLYARIDVVTPEASAPVLLEAELFEPSLYLRHSDRGVDQFAAAIAQRLP